MAPSAVIIANAIRLSDIERIYRAGADYVYMSRLEVADALHSAIDQALQYTLAPPA